MSFLDSGIWYFIIHFEELLIRPYISEIIVPFLIFCCVIALTLRLIKW